MKFKIFVLMALCLFSTCSIASGDQRISKKFVSGGRKITLDSSSIEYVNIKESKTRVIEYVVIFANIYNENEFLGSSIPNGTEIIGSVFCTKCGSSNSANLSALFASGAGKISNGELVMTSPFEGVDKIKFKSYNGSLKAVQNYVCDVTANYREHTQKGDNFSKNKGYDTAIKEYEMALEEAKRLDNQEGFNETWQAIVLLHIASVYREQKDYSSATEYLEKIYALKIDNERRRKELTDLADTEIKNMPKISTPLNPKSAVLKLKALGIPGTAYLISHTPRHQIER